MTIGKDLVVGPTANGDGTYSLEYDLTVTNVGAASASYDLVDELLYGAGMSDSNMHSNAALPILLIDGSAKPVSGGRHVRYPNGTPLANLNLTVLDKMGVPVDQMSNSTGKLELLSEV